MADLKKTPDKAPIPSMGSPARPLESFYLDAVLASGASESVGGMAGGGEGGGRAPVQVGSPVVIPNGGLATFKLRKRKGKTQIFMADPNQAVTWNGEALANESDYSLTSGDWSDLDSIEADETKTYYLEIHLKLLFDRTTKTRTIKETIGGVEQTVERKFPVTKFRSIDTKSYKVTDSSSPEEAKSDIVAKKPEGGGGAPLSSRRLGGPFVRWTTLRAAGDETETLEAEVDYCVLLGSVGPKGAKNSVLGALHFVNFLGWEDYDPDAEEGTGTGTETGTETGTAETGTSEETGTSGGETGEPGGGTEEGTGTSGETGTSSEETGTSGVVTFVGDVKYECPNLMKRMDTFDPSTGKVTKGEWTTMEGGVCVPHSSQHS